MFVCLCNSVTDHQIIDAIDEGVSSFEAMQDKLGVASSCGNCSCEVKRILQNKIAQNMARQPVQANITPLSAKHYSR